MKEKLFIVSSITFSLIVLAACNWNLQETEPPLAQWQCGSELKDERDGRTYRTIWIDKDGGNDLSKPGQCWMQENLNYGNMIQGDTGVVAVAGEKFCFDNVADSCEKYGALYTWEAAIRACPPGWHLPNDLEWKMLEYSLGMSLEDLDITDYRPGLVLYGDCETCFQALLTGIYQSGCPDVGDCPGCFKEGTCNGSSFWTSTTSTIDNDRAFVRSLRDDPSINQVGRFTQSKRLGYCVRCLRN